MPCEEIAEQRFWQIIDQAQGSSRGSTEELAENLRGELRNSNQQEIVAFHWLFALKA